MSKPILKCGYVPLVDSAPLIIAQQLAFASQEGIELRLMRQPSWSALRDLLAHGSLDAAHMLAPMPIAMSLGLSGIKTDISALMMMSVNGTVTGVSKRIAQDMKANGWTGAFQDPKITRDIILSLHDRPLKIGVPFPYSMHHLLTRYWIGDQIERFEIVTTPPPMMAEAVEAGDIDLFTVGEPWGTVAVESGAAQLVLPGSNIWQFAPEKVLATRADWLQQNTSTAGKLMRAIYRACEWLDQTDNHTLAAEILSRSEHLDLPDSAIDRALTGQIVPKKNGDPQDVENFLRFNQGGTNFPWRSQAAWIGAQIAQMHGLDQVAAARDAQACFRPDIYREQLAPLGIDMPGASAKLEGAMANRTAVASTRGDMILGPDAFFDGKTYEMPAKI